MSDQVYVPTSSAIAASQMTAFTRYCEERLHRSFPAYADLHAFAVSEPNEFWSHLLEWLDVPYEGEASPALIGHECETAVFFPGIRLNYAETLLQDTAGADDSVALVACDESGTRQTLTRAELRERVLRLSAGLLELGVKPGDRVVAIARNSTDASTL